MIYFRSLYLHNNYAEMLPDSIVNIIINTGNIISSKELKKKATQSPSEEVCDSVSGAFNTWLKTEKVDLASSSVFCNNFTEDKSEKLDRADLKISVKIFLGNYSCKALKTSISQVMQVLEIDMIDSLILSMPASRNNEQFNLDDMKPFWNELENFVREGKIITIGVSDLDTGELAELYNWTEIKPSVNQVNLESCCVMPTEMIAFAKENDIQLLTHNDPKVLLSNEMLEKILEAGVRDPTNWRMDWIVRYAVVVKCRGIIQNKGYLLCTVKT